MAEKVKVKINHSGREYWFRVLIRGLYPVSGPPMSTPLRAEQSWREFAEMFGIIGDAWEWDND